MEKHQEQEWAEAQKIVISTDLVAATKKHLQFLEVVENNGNLYDGPLLEKAIYRYKYCWLPLLAKHTESDEQEIQLVVPLDCEWIWHCHMLNPVRYMVDCKELFGRILDRGCVVISSIEKACKKQTEEIWHKQYPEEPYELNFGDDITKDTGSILATTPSTNYDLVSAVMRQSSFYHKVSRTMFKDDLYLEEAAHRYKGFLHLVKKNMEMKSKKACVPTYDIDLMWHSHQLHPLSYCKDVSALVGQVLHHDDTDRDQSKGGKLDVSTKSTTKQWGEMFGSLYYRVGSRQVTKGTEGEKLTAMAAKCSCMAEDMEGQKLIALTAKCSCMAEDMERQKLIALTAKCSCMAEDMERQKLIALTAKCSCMVEDMDGQKLIALTAKCSCMTEDMEAAKSSEMAARCKCLAKDIDGENSFEMTARCKCISGSMETEKPYEMIAKCMTTSILQV